MFMVKLSNAVLTVLCRTVSGGSGGRGHVMLGTEFCAAHTPLPFE